MVWRGRVNFQGLEVDVGLPGVPLQYLVDVILPVQQLQGFHQVPPLQLTVRQLAAG